jgi:N-acetylmuramoyl-L-alanine amidase
MIKLNTLLYSAGWTAEQVVHTPLLEGRPTVVIRPGHGAGSGVTRGNVEEHQYFWRIAEQTISQIRGVNAIYLNRLVRGQPGFSVENTLVDALIADTGGIDLQLHINYAVTSKAHGCLTAYSRGNTHSRRFAQILQRQVADGVGLADSTACANGLLPCPEPGFENISYLIGQPASSSVLLEAGFLSNFKDFLALSNGSQKMATAIANSFNIFYAE